MRLTTLKPRLQELKSPLRELKRGTNWKAQDRDSRHQRGYGTAWDKLRLVVLQRDAGLCQVCMDAGILKVGNEVDHIIPKYRGGTDDLGNLEVLCRTCHQVKTAAESAAARRGEG
jgi:5-methylcytosine-specific restriction protein A